MALNKLIPIVALFVIGCGQPTKKPVEQDRIPEPDVLIRLEGQKAMIDSSRMKKNLLTKVYARVHDQPTPVEVRDLKWPKDIDEVYNIWYTPDTQIVCFGAYPFSQTGDWDMGLTHYFDSTGNTFAFERTTSFYNSLCTDDLAIEQIVTYYHNEAMVDSVYVFTDVKGNSLESDSCEFPYDFPYRIYTNANDVLRNVGITAR